MSTALVFVYNADSGLFNALTDVARRLLFSDSYPCNLCALTHSSFGMRREWKDFVAQLDPSVEFLHADELKSRYGVREVRLPAVFERLGDGLEICVYKEALDACKTLRDLKLLVMDTCQSNGFGSVVTLR